MKADLNPLFAQECDSGIYSKSMKHIQYVPTMREKVSAENCYKTVKYDELIDEIKQKDLPKDVKKMLLLAATRHIVFNYQLLAEFYSQAEKDVQELMEKSGLVIIDFDDALVHPQKESYWGNVNPDGIRSCYDEGKRGAETLCFDYNREFGTKIKVVRIFNTYGPWMSPDDGRVVSNFIIQALKGEDITIYGNGSQTRSFQYIDDLIDGFLAMMKTKDDFLGPVNIGNPEEFTMLELAEKVLRFTKSNSRLVFKELPSDDPKQRKPDISLAKEKLNFEPKINLETGLKKTIEYFKSL